MRRKVPAVFLAALLLLSALPALAAEGGPVVRALGTNGTVTVGLRSTPDAGPVGSDGFSTWPTDLLEPVYTTDGVNWQTGAWDQPPGMTPVRGGWNGSEFIIYEYLSHTPDYRSKDGVHWTRIPADSAEDIPTYSPGSVTVGPYHFELKDGELYLVSGDTAALLPDAGEAARELGIGLDEIRAYSAPGGVRVECLQSVFGDPTQTPFHVTVYPVSSLDWVREHQSTLFWDPEVLEESDSGSVTVRKVAVGSSGERWEYRAGGADGGWTPITATWCQDRNGAHLLPWNGKSFLILDNWSLQLYASEDGAHWRCLRDTFLAPEKDAGMFQFWPVNYSSHSLTWTGSEYMACRRTAESRYGMMGSSGGVWYSPYCSKVCFADEKFGLTGEYDFGRQVLSVGYWNGVYYAEVSRSEGISDGIGDATFAHYSPDDGTDIYRSADKVNWERTDLKQIASSIQPLV